MLSLYCIFSVEIVNTSDVGLCSYPQMPIHMGFSLLVTGILVDHLGHWGRAGVSLEHVGVDYEEAAQHISEYVAVLESGY